MTSKPIVLFFFTDFNSIDHMLPVAYKLASTGRGTAVPLLTNAFYNIDGDYRLDFLKREHGVKTESVFNFHQKNPFVRWFMGRLCRPLGSVGVRAKLYPKLVKVISRLFYRRAWARQVLGKYRPTSIVFERAYADGGLVGALIMEAQKREIPSYSLPHAVLSQVNELLTWTEVELGDLPKMYHMNRFDHVAYESSFHAERAVKEGLSPDRIAVLGSPRYCDEWSSINQRIQPTLRGFQPAGDVTGRLKVVFMMTQWNYNVHRGANLETLTRLSKLDDVYLVVKAHPRWTAADLGEFLERDLPENVEVVWEVPSPALIEWADAVLNIGSSIALEVLIQKKPLFQLKYLHSNTTVCEELGACWLVNDDWELEAALRQLKEGSPLPYGEEQVAKVMSAVVLGDSPGDPDVLGRYVDFILKDSQEAPPARSV